MVAGLGWGQAGEAGMHSVDHSVSLQETPEKCYREPKMGDGGDMAAVGSQGFLSVVCPQAPWDEGENAVLGGGDSMLFCGAGVAWHQMRRSCLPVCAPV